MTDCETITLLIAGEYWGLGDDKAIWRHFKDCWQSWFPTLGGRTRFVRQAANLYKVQENMRQLLSEKPCNNKGLFLFDGFPIAVCHHIRRYKRNRTFGEHGSVSYCEAKDQHYFGFKAT